MDAFTIYKLMLWAFGIMVIIMLVMLYLGSHADNRELAQLQTVWTFVKSECYYPDGTRRETWLTSDEATQTLLMPAHTNGNRRIFAVGNCQSEWHRKTP